MSEQLEKDPNGNIIVKPVTGWTTHAIAGMNVLLSVEYAGNRAELETEALRHHVPLLLTAPQALELAQGLTRAANLLLRQDDTRH